MVMTQMLKILFSFLFVGFFFIFLVVDELFDCRWNDE